MHNLNLLKKGKNRIINGGLLFNKKLKMLLLGAKLNHILFSYYKNNFSFEKLKK